MVEPEYIDENKCVPIIYSGEGTGCCLDAYTMRSGYEVGIRGEPAADRRASITSCASGDFSST